MYLYHYYEKATGPFRNLSDLTIEEAQKVLNYIKQKNDTTLAAQRYDDYIERRRELEQIVRRIFIKKGGKPQRKVPHNMALGECPWILSWYVEGESIKIPLRDFNLDTVSFTYGDMFPNFSDRVEDTNEYRRTAYKYHEIIEIINKYGYPVGKCANGSPSPFRYIEAQIWSDDVIQNYKGIK